MKTILMAFVVLLASTATFAQAKKPVQKHHHTAVVKKYICTMHPEVVRSKPGKCPKCGMELVAMKKK